MLTRCVLDISFGHSYCNRHTQYMWMIVGCALLGFGTAPLWPCVITGTTEVAGDEGKATIMSVVYMAWLSGVGLGPVAINFFVGENNYASHSIVDRLYDGCRSCRAHASTQRMSVTRTDGRSRGESLGF